MRINCLRLNVSVGLVIPWAMTPVIVFWRNRSLRRLDSMALAAVCFGMLVKSVGIALAPRRWMALDTHRPDRRMASTAN